MNQTKTLPHDKASEMMVLGCMLTSITSLNVASDCLEEADFYYPEHKSIFSALKTAHTNNKPADIHLIAQDMKKNERLDAVGGIPYLTTLAQYAGTSAFIEEYVKIVREKHVLRQIVIAAQYIEKEALEGPANVTAFIESFYKKLDGIKQKTSKNHLDKQLKLEQEETAKIFLEHHKEAFSNGTLISGFKEIDKRLFYVPGDLVIVQGMSNHGKTKWMEEKAYKFITNERNAEKKPVCVFVSFENSTLFVKEDILNLISKYEKEGDKFISHDARYFEKKDVRSPFLYPDIENEFHSTVFIYDTWKKSQSIIFMENVKFEELNELISKLKKSHKDRPIAIFLDYIQIIPNDLNSDGWERIKEISYGLEKIAQSNKVIIIAGSQVNEKRETREGKDVYNAATIVEDVFNHSHSSLEMNPSLKAKFVSQIDGKNVVSITITKYKRGPSFSLEEAFLFDGRSFISKNETNNFDRFVASRRMENGK